MQYYNLTAADDLTAVNYQQNFQQPGITFLPEKKQQINVLYGRLIMVR
jgi:hypothetical protein